MTLNPLARSGVVSAPQRPAAVRLSEVSVQDTFHSGETRPLKTPVLANPRPSTALKKALLLTTVAVAAALSGCGQAPAPLATSPVTLVPGGAGPAKKHDAAAPVDAEALRAQATNLLGSQATPGLVELLAIGLWERGLPENPPSRSDPPMPGLGYGFEEFHFMHNLSEEQKQSWVGDYTARLATAGVLPGASGAAVLAQLNGKFRPDSIWTEPVTQGSNRWQSFGTFEQQLTVNRLLEPHPAHFQAGAKSIPVYGLETQGEKQRLTAALQYLFDRGGAQAMSGVSEFHIQTVTGRMLDEKGTNIGGVGGEAGTGAGQVVLTRGPLADFSTTVIHEIGHNLETQSGLLDRPNPFGTGDSADDYASSYARVNAREDVAETHVLLINAWEMVKNHPGEALQGKLGEKLQAVAKGFYGLELTSKPSAKYQALLEQVKAGKTPLGKGDKGDFLSEDAKSNPEKDFKDTQLYLLRNWRTLHENPEAAQGTGYISKVRWVALNLFNEELGERPAR